jgi:basic amino acid/polyamine antiporter, APA family
MRDSPVPAPQLRRVIGASQLFTLGFGAIVGVGFVVGLGEWLSQAGPLGAILAFVAGGALTVLIGFCHAEMATAMPVSGGEVAYAYEVFGLRTCFATGWLLALAEVAVLAFEGLSLAWIVGVLVPGVHGPALYESFGEPVTLGSLLIGLGGMALIAWLNYRGISPTARLQDALTYAKIGLALVVIVVGLSWGRAANLRPFFQVGADGSIWGGMLNVFLTSPFWLAGFSVIARVMEEKAPRTSAPMVGRMLLLSIVSAALFYCLVILACSMLLPWRTLVALDLPAARGFEVALGSSILTKTMLVVALLGNITVWNSSVLAGSRILFALGRAQVVGARFGQLHPVHRSPAAAIVFLSVASCIGILLGRRAIMPVVNVASFCFSMSYLLVCLSVLKLRQTRTEVLPPYRAPGGRLTAVLAAASSLLMVGLALYQPAVAAPGRLPMEWTVLMVWTLLGGGFWLASQGLRGRIAEGERRALILGSQSAAAS